jgi:hypothetical protein
MGIKLRNTGSQNSKVGLILEIKDYATLENVLMQLPYYQIKEDLSLLLSLKTFRKSELFKSPDL